MWHIRKERGRLKFRHTQKQNSNESAHVLSHHKIDDRCIYYYCWTSTAAKNDLRNSQNKVHISNVKMVNRLFFCQHLIFSWQREWTFVCASPWMHNFGIIHTFSLWIIYHYCVCVFCFFAVVIRKRIELNSFVPTFSWSSLKFDHFISKKHHNGHKNYTAWISYTCHRFLWMDIDFGG